MLNFRLEKIDQKTARRRETKEDVTVINIESLRQRKKEITVEITRKNQEHEQEVARLQKELVEINEVVSEFEKLL